ncbi:hypothetical protein [Streptomyces sp. NBC_00316]|uniref:hypothetical protein n=1 Tax=Streptomyces sp. NBC_00316 TaxID=2975710 RepID=UPI002E2DEF83|nr:hypothetical protein [Streptomyces sp. NBC_00316]
MANRKVHRRATKVLGTEPSALVWCSVPRSIPKPPGDVHRAAGKGRLKGRHHLLVYVGAVVFCAVIIPICLIDMLGQQIDRLIEGRSRRSDPNRRQGTPARDRGPGNGIFDGDWNLTAGQLMLRWFSQSPSPRRLVLLDRDRICVAASPRRRLAATKADDFEIVAEFRAGEARIEAEAGQPRGFAAFRIRFADGSWLELGRLAGPKGADRFLRTTATGA